MDVLARPSPLSLSLPLQFCEAKNLSTGVLVEKWPCLLHSGSRVALAIAREGLGQRFQLSGTLYSLQGCERFGF